MVFIREQMQYDVVTVGAGIINICYSNCYYYNMFWLGPAGLSAAIRLKQLAAKNGQEISVCVVEKGISR